MNAPLDVLDAGTLRYGEALALQRRAVEEVKAGGADRLILVEHPPVVTLGRRAREEHVLVSREALAARGVEAFEIERGGDVTYHGPGQLVGYPVIDIRRRGIGLDAYLRLLEAALIDAVGTFGIDARRRKGLTGVWADAGKIAAIGVAVTRWVTYHGFALNVSTDLSAFDLIVPCGLAGETVTSMEKTLGRAVDMADAKREVVRAMNSAL